MRGPESKNGQGNSRPPPRSEMGQRSGPLELQCCWGAAAGSHRGPGSYASPTQDINPITQGVFPFFNLNLYFTPYTQP